jgi:hypothetical protein
MNEIDEIEACIVLVCFIPTFRTLPLVCCRTVKRRTVKLGEPQHADRRIWQWTTLIRFSDAEKNCQNRRVRDKIRMHPRHGASCHGVSCSQDSSSPKSVSNMFSFTAKIYMMHVTLLVLGSAVLLQPLVVLLGFSGCLGQSAQSSVNAGCPSGLDGLFPDPNSCRFFLECRTTDQGQTSFRHQCSSSTPYFQPASTIGFGYCTASAPTGSTNCQLQDFPQSPGNSGSQQPITMFPPYNGNNQVSPKKVKYYNKVSWTASSVSQYPVSLSFGDILSCDQL